MKEDRYEQIIQMLDDHKTVRVSEITDRLNVTDMTIRRDLKELEDKGLLQRVHGGAKKIEETAFAERSHSEKKEINIEEKKRIGKLAASFVAENDVIFIGSGTTNEFIIDYLDVSAAKIITNSIDIFSKISSDDRFEVILIGGKLRKRTGTFIGTFSTDMLKKINVHKAFVGTNGIYDNHVTTANEEEGDAQRIVLDRAEERYVLADSSKLGVKAFYSFFPLSEATAVITGTEVSAEIAKTLKTYTSIIY